MPAKTATDKAPAEGANGATEPEPQPEPPANVVQALARVMAELPGIGRDQQSEQGYNYRGIEAITRHAQALLARYGVVFTPHVERRAVKDFTINNRPWTEDELWVRYRVYGPGGTDDFIEVGPVVGLGRDNSDKGANKAMTQAFKYALIQTLCIGDGKDDPDADLAAEADPAQHVDPDRAARQHLSGRIRALAPEQRDAVRAFCDERQIPRVPAQFTDEQLADVEAEVDRLVQLAEAEQRPEHANQGAPADPEWNQLEQLSELREQVEALTPYQRQWLEQAMAKVEVTWELAATDEPAREHLATLLQGAAQQPPEAPADAEQAAKGEEGADGSPRATQGAKRSSRS